MLGIPVDMGLDGADLRGLGELAHEAERRGIDRLWAPELYRSASVPLAVAAAATKRIELATGIALAFTRSALVLALEALDLDELSGGRLVVGLGAGVRRLNERWHAVPYDPPVRRMREVVAGFRELVAAMSERRDARSEGRLVDLEVVGYRRPHPVLRPRIPVWLAAVQRGMAALAGEIADGLLDHPVTTVDWLTQELLPSIRRGAERAGRTPPPVAGALICAVSADNPQGARRAAACTVGFYATVRTYEPLFAGHGYGDRLTGVRRAFLRGDADALAEAVGEDMVDTFAAAGTPEQVRASAGRYEGVVERLWATAPHHLQQPADTLRWQRGILEALGQAA
jgi:probable F420-dependent oxidoreductase